MLRQDLPMNQRLPATTWLLFNPLTMMMLLNPYSDSLVQGQTRFDFRTFDEYSTDKLLSKGDVQFNASSVWLNPTYTGVVAGRPYSCGEVIYADRIQMRADSDSSVTGKAVASFNTSFTFSMTGMNSAGMAFTFLVGNHSTGGSGASLCLLLKHNNGNPANQIFAVEFDTYQNPEFNDPSNNHVGVNVNSMNSTSVSNLCGNGESCVYLVTGEEFTSWIDYDSTTQTLQVFLIKGSLLLGVSKPANALIHVPNLDLSNVFNDYMFVGFTGSAAMDREVKSIKSWNFNTGPSFAGKKSKSKGGLIAGIVAAVCVLTFTIFCISFVMLKRRAAGKSGGGDHGEEPLSTELSSSALPLHIFISHTGGVNGAEKNFAISLANALESSALELKYSYVVFIDRHMKKGTLFPTELLQQIERTDVAIVVVTEEYFHRPWPMLELVKFVELYMKNTPPKVRVLPLFYKLTTKQVRSLVRQQSLEEAWKSLSTERHPINVAEYRRAVETLCNLNGVEYNFIDYSHDAEYIEVILREVSKIYVEIRT